jgi:hypothetical protein
MVVSRKARSENEEVLNDGSEGSVRLLLFFRWAFFCPKSNKVGEFFQFRRLPHGHVFCPWVFEAMRWSLCTQLRGLVVLEGDYRVENCGFLGLDSVVFRFRFP